MISKLILYTAKALNVLFVAGIFGIIVYLNRDSIVTSVRSQSEGFQTYNFSFGIYNQLFPEVENLSTQQNVAIFTDSLKINISEEKLRQEVQKIESLSATLTIPSVSIDGPIVGGGDESAMERGFWHYPGTAIVGENGNFVIVGHRFLKIPPHKDTFYNLDKVHTGDEIIIKTNFGTWKYVVTQKRIVNNDEVSVLNHTAGKRLTLITCHPLWTSKQRLVIIARLVTEGITL